MYQPFLNFLQLYRHIPAHDETVIAEALEYREVKEGEVLLTTGDYAREMFFIGKGVLKITSVNEKGTVVTHFFLKENQFCTILHSFNNNVPAHENIIAATDAQLVVFNREKLFGLYNTLPYFKELIHSITQQALLNKIQLRNSYLGEDATSRYHNFLMNQSDVALRVALSDVASYLGITQQSLSRIRKNKS
jgi:CRP-like cAMP-binding protein